MWWTTFVRILNKSIFVRVNMCDGEYVRVCECVLINEYVSLYECMPLNVIKSHAWRCWHHLCNKMI